MSKSNRVELMRSCTRRQCGLRIIGGGRADFRCVSMRWRCRITKEEVEVKKEVVKNMSIKMVYLIQAEERITSECREILSSLKINSNITKSINI